MLNQYAITRQTSYWYCLVSGKQMNHSIKTQTGDQLKKIKITVVHV